MAPVWAVAGFYARAELFMVVVYAPFSEQTRSAVVSSPDDGKPLGEPALLEGKHYHGAIRNPHPPLAI